ncbi:hypothetical protein PsorP6_002575 [Peronosclerospora sorghi]|uniref:Uncharacterized protein n=1 Tax=Peronosclerospora sorghi TaxID=230839 RepID=A0ACC0WTC9_9STRA|nr:hypothetical protein PsorP6_002575 [Peronosclerospora sorghi]
MTSYLERWKLQREQSRLQRLNDHRNCYNRDVGDELTFISDTELNKDAETEAQSYQSRDESFNFPSVDDFPASKSEEKHQHIGKDDEFVNGEVYWEQGNSIGRPSDFFEKKSRSLSHVELSSPRNVDDFTFQENLIGSEISELRLSSVPQSTDDGLDALVTNRCDRNSGLTGSNTAFSSGCELHFDSSRLVYTPNSLKNLQEKSRLKSEKAKYDSNEPDHIIADYVGEAEVVINNGPSLPDQDIPEIPSSEYMATLLRGPEVIKKALHELNALIDKSISFASSSPKQDPRDAHTYKELHELVPRYEHPKESMLPLSRTTDSWGEDTSISQVDDDVGCRSQDFESLYRNHQPGAQLKMGSRKSKSQEMPDLDTIREVPCPSNTDYVLRSPQSTFGRNNYSLPPHLQTQCPFDTSIYINEVQEQQEDSLHTKCAESSHDHKSDENSTKIKRYAHDETERSWIVGSNSVDLNCEYSREEKNDNLPQNILSSKYEDDKCYTNDNMVSRSKAVQQQALASDRNNMVRSINTAVHFFVCFLTLVCT